MGRRVWILACDSNKPIGGVLQLYRLAEILNSLDYQTSIVVNTDNFTPTWFSSSVSSISYDRLRSLSLHSSSDILIIPETLVYLKHLWRGLPTVIFNQNATYTLGVPPSFTINLIRSSFLENYLDPDIVQVLSVSSYDISYLSSLLHLPDSSLSLIANLCRSFVCSLSFKDQPNLLYASQKLLPSASILCLSATIQSLWSCYFCPYPQFTS